MAKRQEWCETFFSGLYGDVLDASFPPEVSENQAEVICQLLRLRKGQRVLDLACGQGRISIELARLGLEVTGVDLTASFVRDARRAARAAEVEARFLQGDMRAIDFDGEFHACVNWFTSFGYFGDDENLDVLRRVHRALRPGGRLLLDLINKSWMVRRVLGREQRVTGGVRITQASRWSRDGDRLLTTWGMCKGRKKEKHTISLRIYGAPDVRRLLRAAGFREIELLGAPGFGRLTPGAPRMLAVARKTKR